MQSRFITHTVCQVTEPRSVVLLLKPALRTLIKDSRVKKCCGKKLTARTGQYTDGCPEIIGSGFMASYLCKHSFAYIFGSIFAIQGVLWKT
jgi:hypothetical protein